MSLPEDAARLSVTPEGVASAQAFVEEFFGGDGLYDRGIDPTVAKIVVEGVLARLGAQVVEDERRRARLSLFLLPSHLPPPQREFRDGKWCDTYIFEPD